jgi:alpha-amylase
MVTNFKQMKKIDFSTLVVRNILATNIIVIVLLLMFSYKTAAQNDVMMQAFYWNVPVDKDAKNGTWWDILNGQADELKSAGITGIWIPCPSKGNWGIEDMGYGVYDHYDLGNYNQKGTVETRFGSRTELENMLAKMHQSPKMDVYADIILNHVYGSDENLEANPAVKAYVFGEAHNGANVAYPTNEIKWVIPNASPGDYFIQIKGYNLDWNAAPGERGYDVNINWTGASSTENGDWESEPNNGNGDFNTFPGSGYSVRAHADYSGDIDEYKITVSTTHDIVVRLYAKRENTDPWEWVWADNTNGYYPLAIWYNNANLATTTLEAQTTTALNYVTHTGAGEPNYNWNYSHFHPADANDWLGGPGSDEVIPNTKMFGNDFNTYDAVVQDRLNDWGYWLANNIGFDGFRLDFVRGFQEAFAAAWINNLPLLNGNQRFIVGEYWGADYRIKDWVNTLSAQGAQANGFDFPLKSTLKDMCNGNQSSFNMAWLNHAGMVRNNSGNGLPGTSVVTFADNHDTGKEHDKWITKDFKMAYAYMLTHEGRPCIFYPHYYGITQYDNSDASHSVTAPASLKEDINKLIFARKTYLGGTLTVLSEVGNPYPSEDTYNVYVARRQGNGIKGGAIIVLNNNDTETKGLWIDTSPAGYGDLTGQVLVNAFDPTQTTTVYSDGRAWFSAPARGYTIWVKQSDYVAYSATALKGTNMPLFDPQTSQALDVTLLPNPAKDITTLYYELPKESTVQVKVFDHSGRLLSEESHYGQVAGRYSFPINTQEYSPGLYFLQVSDGLNTKNKQLIITN